MNADPLKKFSFAALLMAAATMPAYAHIGIGPTSSFSAGFDHPLSGLDHLTVMIAVGLWAALRGGKAIWAWPAAFVGVMLVGAGLGVAVLPGGAVRGTDSGATPVPLAGVRARRDIGLSWRLRGTLSPAAERFREFVAAQPASSFASSPA